MLNSAEAAAAVGTTPKMLRRYLRSTTDWASCGNGGRYTFKKNQMAALKKGFDNWSEGKRSRYVEDPQFAYLDEDPGLPVEVLTRQCFVDRQEVLARRRARFRKLDARIREVGIKLHEPKADDDLHAEV